MTIEAMLAERKSNYGDYAGGTKIAMDLFAIMQASPFYSAMTAGQQYAMFMLCAKTARLLNGNPNHVDSWTDIAGYVERVLETLTGDEK